MFDVLMLVCSFAGGIIGAAVGGTPAFILCGAAIAIGEGLNISTGDPHFLNLVAWGPFLGPYAAFVGGVAAAAYAYRTGKLNSGRDISSSLMGLDAPDVLMVGGLFGALGYIFKTLLDLVPSTGDIPWTNSVALSIVITTVLARVIFGRSGIFGKVRKGDNRWQPSETASWLPWQSHPLQLILIAIGVSLPIAYVTALQPALLGLLFSVSVMALILLQAGLKAPVIFHIALSAGIVSVTTRNIWWGLAFGTMAAFLGEIYACIFLNHGDSHIDPPSATLATMFTLQALLAVTGILEISGFAPLMIAVMIAFSGYFILNGLRRKAVPQGIGDEGSTRMAGSVNV